MGSSINPKANLTKYWPHKNQTQTQIPPSLSRPSMRHHEGNISKTHSLDEETWSSWTDSLAGMGGVTDTHTCTHTGSPCLGYENTEEGSHGGGSS